jgi:hypothetical protein
MLNDDHIWYIFPFCTHSVNFFFISRQWLHLYAEFCKREFALNVTRHPQLAPQFRRLKNVRDIEAIHSRVQQVECFVSLSVPSLDFSPYKSLRGITLTGDFDGEITLAPRVESLALNFAFNRPFHAPASLQRLDLGVFYNHPITTCARVVKLSARFNHDFRVAPETECLRVGAGFDARLEFSVSGRLRELFLNSVPNYTLELPPSVRHFSVVTAEDAHVVLNHELETLHWVCESDVELPPLLRRLYWKSKSRTPKDLSVLKHLRTLHWNASTWIIALPDSVRELELGNYDFSLSLPAGLVKLKTYNFDRALVLPPGVRELEIGRLFSQTVEWSPALTHLVWKVDIPLWDIPASVTHLYWFSAAPFFCPRSVLFLYTDWTFSRSLILSTFTVSPRTTADATRPLRSRGRRWSCPPSNFE